MVRTAFVLCLLGFLAAAPAPASARPTAPTWWFWLSKPEHHGSRKLAGDFRPVYTTYHLHSHERAARRTMPGDFKPVTASYRRHSRERRGLFSFLHFGRHRASSVRRSHAPTPAAPRKSRTTL